MKQITIDLELRYFGDTYNSAMTLTYKEQGEIPYSWIISQVEKYVLKDMLEQKDEEQTEKEIKEMFNDTNISIVIKDGNND